MRLFLGLIPFLVLGLEAVCVGNMRSRGRFDRTECLAEWPVFDRVSRHIPAFAAIARFAEKVTDNVAVRPRRVYGYGATIVFACASGAVVHVCLAIAVIVWLIGRIYAAHQQETYARAFWLRCREEE